MKIAVVSETSSGDKNKDVVAALQGFGHEIINAGMKDKSVIPELSYIETGLLSAILLNAGIVDFVVGGCGSGQGYMNSVLQYPDWFADSSSTQSMHIYSGVLMGVTVSLLALILGMERRETST